MKHHVYLAQACIDSYTQETGICGNLEFLINDTGSEIVIAVRGSESPFGTENGWIDWITNIRFVPWYNRYAGWCHAGWIKAADELAAVLLQNLGHQVYKPIVVTGHSLGGAVGAMTALLLKNRYYYDVQEVVTFAAPKPFVFVRPNYPFAVTCYESKADIVPRVPHLYRSISDDPVFVDRRIADGHKMSGYLATLKVGR